MIAHVGHIGGLTHMLMPTLQAYVPPVDALTVRGVLKHKRSHRPCNDTRYLKYKNRSVFMFLKLPAELRLMIYEHCLTLNGITKVIDRYYHTFKLVKETTNVKAPLIWVSVALMFYKFRHFSYGLQLRPPILFRLNRQIYKEAVTLLPKRSVLFNHGLLDLANVQDFVAAQVLRTIASITITDTGHDLFRGVASGATSWYGYTELITQLGVILAPGHQLKEFTLEFTSTELKPHVEHCWGATHICGYRDTLHKAVGALRRVRNVGHVKLIGLPETLANELRLEMEKPYLTF